MCFAKANTHEEGPVGLGFFASLHRQPGPSSQVRSVILVLFDGFHIPKTRRSGPYAPSCSQWTEQPWAPFPTSYVVEPVTCLLCASISWAVEWEYRDTVQETHLANIPTSTVTVSCGVMVPTLGSPDLQSSLLQGFVRDLDTENREQGPEAGCTVESELGPWIRERMCLAADWVCQSPTRRERTSLSSPQGTCRVIFRWGSEDGGKEKGSSPPGERSQEGWCLHIRLPTACALCWPQAPLSRALQLPQVT